MRYECVVVGASAGGLNALRTLLGALPSTFAVPVVVAQHLMPARRSAVAKLLDAHCALSVSQAFDKAPLLPGTACIAPPDYHLLVDRSQAEPEEHSKYHAALSQEPPVLFCRPSIDVLFESAAATTRGKVISVLLTGANADGARGSLCVQQWGGRVLVQDPGTAVAPAMPAAALALLKPDRVANLQTLARDLLIHTQGG